MLFSYMIQFQSSYFSFLCKPKLVSSSQKSPSAGNRGDRQPSYHPSGPTQATLPPPRHASHTPPGCTIGCLR